MAGPWTLDVSLRGLAGPTIFGWPEHSVYSRALSLKRQTKRIPKLNFNLTDMFGGVRVIVTLQKIVVHSSRINAFLSTADVIAT